jgi:hypothetical protein
MGQHIYIYKLGAAEVGGPRLFTIFDVSLALNFIRPVIIITSRECTNKWFSPVLTNELRLPGLRYNQPTNQPTANSQHWEVLEEYWWPK